MAIKAVLFDMDNTLILFDEPEFFKAYAEKLYLYFRDILTPHQFLQKLMHSTQMMVNNNGEKTNAEFFIEDFATGMSESKEKLWQRFEKFYATEFEQFQYLMKPLKDARDVIMKIKQNGMKIVVASNPLFPAHVQHIRLRWANLDDISFDLITSAENSTYCKPRLEYYYEICSKINVKPEESMMVGNDAFNDMIASKTGMKTYLTTDSEHLSIEMSRELTKNAKMEMPQPDYKGPLRDLTKII